MIVFNLHLIDPFSTTFIIHPILPIAILPNYGSSGGNVRTVIKLIRFLMRLG